MGGCWWLCFNLTISKLSMYSRDTCDVYKSKILNKSWSFTSVKKMWKNCYCRANLKHFHWYIIELYGTEIQSSIEAVVLLCCVPPQSDYVTWALEVWHSSNKNRGSMSHKVCPSTSGLSLTATWKEDLSQSSSTQSLPLAIFKL